MRTRPWRAGAALAAAIIEMVHMMYQNETAMQFLGGLVSKLKDEAFRRKEEGV